MDEACVSLAAAGMNVLALEDTGANEISAISDLAVEAVDAGADVIVLGCAGMADLVREVELRAGVPVIDGVAAAVGLVSAMARMGVGTSKRDEYAAT